MKYRCHRCHRPMKQDTDLGPKCRRIAAAAAPASDLFGHDIPSAAKAATERVRVCIEMAAMDAKMAIRHEAAAARRRCGVAA